MLTGSYTHKKSTRDEILGPVLTVKGGKTRSLLKNSWSKIMVKNTIYAHFYKHNTLRSKTFFDS